MMNENVAKVYEELAEIRNGLKNAENQATIEGYLKRLDDAMVYLQTEEEYSYWAIALRHDIAYYQSGNSCITLDYFIKYISKMGELMEVNSEQADAGDKFDAMCESAREICENIASTVQTGYEAARDKVKEEAPWYAAEAASTIREFGQKIGKSLRGWLAEDEPDYEEDSTDEDHDDDDMR